MALFMILCYSMRLLDVAPYFRQCHSRWSAFSSPHLLKGDPQVIPNFGFGRFIEIICRQAGFCGWPFSGGARICVRNSHGLVSLYGISIHTNDNSLLKLCKRQKLPRMRLQEFESCVSL